MAIFQGFGEIPDLSDGNGNLSARKIRDYLFMLREQLDHVLGNLGAENLNENSVEELKNVFTADVEAKLRNDEEHLADLSLTAEGLSLSLSDAENRMTLLEQDVEGISLSIRDKDGNISSVALSSGALDLEELVFRVLKESGATVIDGGNIRTGTISAVTIEGVDIKGSVFVSAAEYSSMMLDAGMISFYDESGERFYGGIYSNAQGWLSLTSGGGAVLNVASDSHLYLRAKAGSNIYLGTSVGETTGIYIGKEDSNVYINGNLYINGVAYGS